jgi:hypothetical protein
MQPIVVSEQCDTLDNSSYINAVVAKKVGGWTNNLFAIQVTADVAIVNARQAPVERISPMAAIAASSSSSRL